MDKRAQHELDRTLDEFGVGLRYPDLIGPAIYQLEPGPPKTVVVCVAHDPPYAALIPSIPQVERLTWSCGVCLRTIHLMPPPVVLEWQRGRQAGRN